MKKNVFTKSIQFLIITLIVLAVFVPKAHSQKAMAAAVIVWLAFSLGQLLWKNRNSWKGKMPSLKVPFRTWEERTPDIPLPVPPAKPAPEPKKKTPDTLVDAELDSVLLHLSLRITEKLKSAYPNAVWQWKDTPSLHELLTGSTVRIVVENMDKFTHADITFDRFGRIHVEPMYIGTFSLNAENEDNEEETPAAEPAVVDVRAWYELIGQRILEAQITELNANGHSQLTIKENGDIVINRQKKEVFVTALDSFPGKNYWNELVTILQENELNAKISGNALQVSWI